MQDKNIFLAAGVRVAVLFLMCFNFAPQGNAQVCIDHDGDGWGWDGSKSCEVDNPVGTISTNAPGNDEITSTNTTTSNTSLQSNAQACIDHDGDGWGWDGSKSCEVENPVGTISTNAPGNDEITSTNTTTSNTSLQNNAQPSPVAINSSALRVLPAACEIESGQNFCNVFAEYNASGAGPHCLFETTPNNQQAVLLTCGNPTKVRVPVAANQSKILELRSGSLEYSNSQLIAQRSIAGISGVQRGSFSLEDTRQPAALRNSSASSLATSWDGRLHFDVMTTGGKRVSVVRVLRSERLNNQPASALSSGNLFSRGRIFISDSMSNAEISSSNFSIPGALGVNSANLEVPFNIALHPDNTLPNNPYRSNANGNAADQGQYETYRLYVVMGTARAGNVVGEYDLVHGNSSRGKKIFLVKFEASVVVSNARTANADVHNVIIHSEARPIRDNQGRLVYGYEPSVTLDGRLIIYSGNTNPSMRNGHGGEVAYIYNADQARIDNWTAPRGLPAMYYVHGPGNPSGQTTVNQHPFSDHFPLAAQPIKQYNGEVLGQSDVVKGAYPWVSPRGSEAFFMGRASFHGPDRAGATMVGFRTNGHLWHMDGEINNSRGNPTNSYNHFSDGDGSGNQFNAIKNAYESRRFHGTNITMGDNTWSNLFFRPMGQFPTSWSTTSAMINAPVPMNPFPESYGFWLTGNRYYEIAFPLYAKDLIAYYPMNEPLYRDQLLLRAYVAAAPGAPNNETLRRDGIDYVTDQTADLSANHHTASLRNGAQYPFEYHDVESLWANSRVLRDQIEGAVGNSIYFPRNGSATAQINEQNIRQITDSQSLSAAFWFNSSATGSSTNLLQLDDLFSVAVNQNQLTATIRNDSAQETFQTNINVRQNQWHHVGLSWRQGELRLYFDGREVANRSVDGNLTVSARQLNLLMGPAGSGAQNLLLKMDEVYLYSAYLSPQDMSTLAWKKRRYSEPQNSFFRSSGMADNYPQLNTNVDVSFTASASEIAVGEQLFNSTSLSRNNTVSCASCHQESRAFTDGQQFATGLDNRQIPKNTPSIANALMGSDYLHSGAASSLETQTIHTIMQNGEMGGTDARQIVGAIPQQLRDQLRQVYQREPEISEVARALAAFVKTVRINGAPDNNLNSLSASAQRGRRLFDGKANCIACHNGSNHSDNLFHDIGLNQNDTDRGSSTQRLDDRFRHKTPTLRNIAQTAPYFHDGSAFDLASVVRHYNDQSHRSGARLTDALLHPLELSAAEINDLVEYLHALDGPVATK